MVVDAVFAAAEGEDEGVWGGGFGVILEVVAAGLGAVAAADDEEAADLAGPDGVDEGGGGVEEDGAVVADLEGAVDLTGQGRAGAGLGDDGAEVVVFEAGAAGDGGEAGGEEAVGVFGSRDEDAVGGGDDGAGEVGEFGFLFLPGTAVVTGEVGVFAEAGVHEGGEHFAVGVDLDVGAFDLAEEVPEVEQVVAGDEDAGAGLGAAGDDGRGGFAEGVDVAGVEQFHDAEVVAAEIEGDFEEAGQVEVDVGHGGEEGFFDEGADGWVGLAEAAGVAGVGGHALEAVEDQFLDGLDIGVLAADAGAEGAADAVSGLLALVAEHGVSSTRGEGGVDWITGSNTPFWGRGCQAVCAWGGWGEVGFWVGLKVGGGGH